MRVSFRLEVEAEFTGSLRVPLPCSGLEMETFDEVECGLQQGYALFLSPEVEGVAVGAAVGSEAVEQVLVQLHRERAAVSMAGAVNGTGAAALSALARETIPPAHFAEDLFDGDLLTELSEVHGEAAG